jgi:hypothetical protein
MLHRAVSLLGPTLCADIVLHNTNWSVIVPLRFLQKNASRFWLGQAFLQKAYNEAKTVPPSSLEASRKSAFEGITLGPLYF